MNNLIHYYELLNFIKNKSYYNPNTVPIKTKSTTIMNYIKDHNDLNVLKNTKFIYSFIIVINTIKTLDIYLDNCVTKSIVLYKNRENYTINDKISLFICICHLILYTNNDKLKKIAKTMILDITECKTHTINSPYILGEYLTYCLKLKLLMVKLKKVIPNSKWELLYETLLNVSLKEIRRIKFDGYILNNDMWGWFNVCIGLESVKILKQYDDKNIRVKQILNYYYLVNKINNNAKYYSYNKGNWCNYSTLNLTMYDVMFFPIAYL